MKTTASFLFVLLFSIWSGLAPAQTVGSFDTSVNFMGATRTLSCYVPNNYDSTINYQVVVGLHGLGDNGSNYRNVLINTLNWNTLFPNTIFIFPDGGDDPSKDFHVPAGDELIIQECIDYLDQNYSIDPNQVILQGFSLGGRSALQYGLDHPADFKGLLLHTPAIQGKLDRINAPTPTGVNYNYANGSLVPIFSTVGANDDFYVDNIEKAVIELKKNNAVVEHRTIIGMDHNVAAASFVTEALAFFNDPTAASDDADVFDIGHGKRSCETSIAPTCFIRNAGGNNLTAVEINYVMGGVTGTTTWTGNLGPFEHAEVNIPAFTASDGLNDLVMSIGAINTSGTDSNPNNNVTEKAIDIVDTPTEAPYLGGFENGFEGWVTGEDPSLFEWFDDNTVSKDGNYSAATFNTILVFNTAGNRESLISPVVDLTNSVDPGFTFDVAFNYHLFTPPSFTADTVFADTLEILVSADCGATWESVYKKGGADLATAPAPIMNPWTLQAAFHTPQFNEWRTDSIDLSNYGQESEVTIKFDYISALGGSIYIDNANFNGSPVGINDPVASNIDYTLYPNPANNQVTLQLEGTSFDQINIYDGLGRQVLSQGGNTGQQTSIDVSQLPNGVYHVAVLSGSERSVKMLTVRH